MIAAIIQARMNSSRLPGKVLRPILGRPMLQHMIERVKAAETVGKTVVITSAEPSDDPIAEFCRRYHVDCYRGSLDDVLDRYYQGARAHRAKVIVRLTADCPLIDPRVIDFVVRRFQKENCDYAANTVPPPSTFPDGMDVEVFSFQALEQAWREAKKPSEREHVTFYFWKNPHLFRTLRCDGPSDRHEFRLTVDYPQDAEVITAIIRDLSVRNPLFSMEEIIDYLQTHPDVRVLNGGIVPNQGLQPALAKDRREGFAS